MRKKNRDLSQLVGRNKYVEQQSPGMAFEAAGSYSTQLNQIAKDEPELYKILAPEPGEHAHHKAILSTLGPLWNNLNEEDSRKLTEYAVSKGIGNSISNLINIPDYAHQGRKGGDSIHQFAQNEGYEYHPNKKKQFGFVKDIIDASELPLDYRIHILDKYLSEALPKMKDKIDDLLTDHYSNQARKAGDVFKGMIRVNSPGDTINSPITTVTSLGM